MMLNCTNERCQGSLAIGLIVRIIGAIGLIDMTGYLVRITIETLDDQIHIFIDAHGIRFPPLS